MIASTALAERLALFTTNPDDYIGPGRLLTVVPVTRPRIPHERTTTTWGRSLWWAEPSSGFRFGSVRIRAQTPASWASQHCSFARPHPLGVRCTGANDEYRFRPE